MDSCICHAKYLKFSSVAIVKTVQWFRVSSSMNRVANWKHFSGEATGQRPDHQEGIEPRGYCNYPREMMRS